VAFGRNSANIDIHATDKTGRAIASARKNLAGLGISAKSLMAGFGGLGAGYLGARMVRDIAGINMEFEQATREVNSLLNLSEAGFRSLQDDIRGVASVVGVDLVVATKAAYQAISAGVGRNDLPAFLTAAAKASIGGLSDTETAVDLLTNVVNAYRASGLTAAHASDVMFTAVKDGKTTFGELAHSMYLAAPIAATVGVSFEELSAAAAAITKMGVPTQVAFTQIRSALVATQKPSMEMVQVLNALGASSANALIKQKGFVGAMALMRAAAEANDISLAKVFGRVEGLSAVLNTTGDNAAAFAQNYANALASAGAAEAAFAENNQTTARSLEKVRAAWQSTVTAFGESDIAIGSLDALARSLQEVSADLTGEVASLTHDLNNLNRLSSEGESAFSKLFSGGETARLYAMRDVWIELGESPRTYAEAIALIEARLATLQSAKGADADATRAQVAAQEELNAALVSQPLADDSAKMNRLEGLIRSFSEGNSTDAQNMAVLRSEIEGLQDSLRDFDREGMHGTEEWADTYIKAMEKAIRLQGMEKRAATEATREQDAALRAIGLGGSPSSASPVGLPVPADPGWRPGHVDLASGPAWRPGQVDAAEAPAATPQSGESTAAEAIRADLKTGGSLIEKVAQSVSEFVQRLEIAEQQIANSR
jgi:TP901 family phage tail tape measure protein